MESGYLLLVEDEPVIQDNNRKILQRRGYKIRLAYTLAETRSIISESPPRAIVLDIQLPDGNGLDFLKELRRTSNIPVLVLTSKGTPQAIIRGLESGGDDYLTKPYDLAVFLTRVEALLRRASILPDVLEIGALRLDPASGRAFIHGMDMVLTQKEYSLLQQFAQHKEKILSAEYLYDKVWGHEMLNDVNSLKALISKLRSKLSGSGHTITASRGEGYYFEIE